MTIYLNFNHVAVMRPSTSPSPPSLHRSISFIILSAHQPPPGLDSTGGIYLVADRGSRAAITNLHLESKRQRLWDFIWYHLLTINIILSSSNWSLPEITCFGAVETSSPSAQDLHLQADHRVSRASAAEQGIVFVRYKIFKNVYDGDSEYLQEKRPIERII